MPAVVVKLITFQCFDKFQDFWGALEVQLQPLLNNMCWETDECLHFGGMISACNFRLWDGDVRNKNKSTNIVVEKCSVLCTVWKSYWISWDTRVLISPYPGQEGNKLMVLSEWREFPSAPCLAGKKIDYSSHLHVVEIARIPCRLPKLLSSWSG